MPGGIAAGLALYSGRARQSDLRIADDGPTRISHDSGDLPSRRGLRRHETGNQEKPCQNEK
jgi:hypothetical protein